MPAVKAESKKEDNKSEKSGKLVKKKCEQKLGQRLWNFKFIVSRNIFEDLHSVVLNVVHFGLKLFYKSVCRTGGRSPRPYKLSVSLLGL